MASPYLYVYVVYKVCDEKDASFDEIIGAFATQPAAAKKMSELGGKGTIVRYVKERRHE